MAAKLKGFLLVFLVVMLSAVFALQFGGGQAEGCTAGGSTYLARVYDKTLSRGDFEAAYAVGNFGRLPAETQRSMGLPQLVLNGLIDRTLLAREARKVGFEVSEGEVMERFVNEGVILLTLGVDAPPEVPQGEIPVSFADKDGKFNAELAKRYIENGLRRSVGEFADGQVDEYLAAQMRELVASTVNVSDAEAWEDYVRENDKAEMQYVRFSPAYYSKQQPDTSEAAVEKWIAENADRLEREYEANKYRYTNLDKQVRSQHILIKTGSYVSDEEKAQAKTKAEALHKRAVAGEDFSTLARKNSGDKITGPKGGDLGYQPKGTMPDAYDEAVFAMKVDEISDMVETEFGYHIIKVLGIREGDVPKEEAKRELADGLYRRDWIESRAKEAATATLALWKSSNDEEVRKKLAANAKKTPESTLTPTLAETGEFGRDSAPLVGLPTNVLLDAVLAVADGETFPSEPVRVGREWVVFRIIDRRRPDKAAFTDDLRDSTREVLRTLKKKETVDLYVRKLRDQAAADQALRINPLQTQDDNS
ncbi:MAG: peptidylprolyl isomerase [Deltaproteobacteria bacterium]|nr:peptidylprolyl isomerase [Deltaproteobacteria bacterium]